MNKPATRTLLALLSTLAATALTGCPSVDEIIDRARRNALIEGDGGVDTIVEHTIVPGHAPLVAESPTLEHTDAAVLLATDAKPATDAAASTDATTDASATAAVDPEDTPGPRMTAVWPFVAVYANPDGRTRIGYLRGGARVRVQPRPVGTDGCSHGWYELLTSGYVCLNNATTLGENGGGAGWHAPLQPDRANPLPFPYMIAHRAAVMYRRPPTQDEMREAEPERFGVVPPLALASAATDAALPGTNNEEPEAPTTRDRTAMLVANRHEAEDAGIRIEDLAGDPNSPVLRRVLQGMYVSVDREVNAAGRRFWRTQGGGFIERSLVSGISNAPTFQGVTLDATHTLPIAFMTAYQGFTYALSPDGHSVSRIAPAPRLTAYSLTADPPVTVGRMRYFRTTDGTYVSEHNTRLVQTHEPPLDLAPGEKWVEVNLDRQQLIAYEGARPVYVTLVSTGRRNQRDQTRNYETIQGSFRIYAKHVSTTMDGNSAGDGPYSIEDVPWVMYFDNSFALHGAFWHSAFGAMHSHGCVNMAPADARWLFGWSEPQVPRGWHGAFTNPQRLGTRVFVHYENQALGERGGPAVVPQH